MFTPSNVHQRVISLCKAREGRNETVFDLVRHHQIDSIPEGALFFLPSYVLCPGRDVPDVQAVSGEPVFMATDRTDEYVVFSPLEITLLADGLDSFNFNFADSQQALDDGEEDEFYALVIPKFGLYLTELTSVPAVVKPARDTPSSKAVKLEFI